MNPDESVAMREFHSRMRRQMIHDVKNSEVIEKLWTMNYLSSGLSFDGQTIDIPSSFLMPELKPRDLELVKMEKLTKLLELGDEKDDKYSSAVVEQSVPSDEQSPDAPHPV